MGAALPAAGLPFLKLQLLLGQAIGVEDALGVQLTEVYHALHLFQNIEEQTIPLAPGIDHLQHRLSRTSIPFFLILQALRLLRQIFSRRPLTNFCLAPLTWPFPTLRLYEIPTETLELF